MASHDTFGLTEGMRLAALGDIESLKAVADPGILFKERNPKTGANILHYAAQALNNGAAIIKWAILEAEAPIELLNEPILVKKQDREEGNGHTVAMEAVFNKSTEVVEALIELRDSGRKVDLETPALTGWSPRGFALRSKLPIAERLPPEGQTFQEAWDAQKAYVKQKENEWLKIHPGEEAAIMLVGALQRYVLEGGSLESIRKPLDDGAVAVNERYGRLGQPLLNYVPTGLSANGLLADQHLRYAEVVDLLLRKGADPRIKETGLMQVSAGFRDAVFGYVKGLELMIAHVPDGEEGQDFINERGIMNGYTRLIDATLFRQSEVIELLLRCGADKNIKGFNGKSA